MFTEGLAFVLPAIADQLVIVLLSLLVLVVAPVEAASRGGDLRDRGAGLRRFIHGRTSGASTALHDDHQLALTLAATQCARRARIAFAPHAGLFRQALRRCATASPTRSAPSQ